MPRSPVSSSRGEEKDTQNPWPVALTGPLAPLSDNPLVTIVVASYNQENYIEDTIASVLNQAYAPIELIVIDGDSNDRTIEILRGYDKEPRLRWYSEADNGPCDALYKGLKLANGDLIGFQLSSDTYAPGAFQEAVQEFATDPQLALVGGAVQEMDEQGHPRDETWCDFDRRHYYSVAEIITLEKYPPLQSTFFRRDIAQAINGNGLEFIWFHTFFFLNLLMEASKRDARSLFVPNIWGNYRRHPGALSETLHFVVKVALTALLEWNKACKDVSKRYKDILTARQVRELRKPGYLREFRYRVGTLRQIWPAIPALLRYFTFGGRPFSKDIRPRGKKIPSYIASFIVSKFLDFSSDVRTAKPK